LSAPGERDAQVRRGPESFLRGINDWRRESDLTLTDNEMTGGRVVTAARVDEPADALRWKRRSVERSLERARSEAEKRSARFVDTARELVEESGGGEFTIQNLVDRMGVSTRTFYQHFSGKDDLIVAMFEDAQRDSVRALRTIVEAWTDPVARLRAFITARYSSVRPTPLQRLLVHHHFELQESHPDELRYAMRPVLDFLRELVEDAAAAGHLRSADHDRTAGLLLQTITASNQAQVLRSNIVGDAPTADEVADMCLHGITISRERGAEGAGG
jgi:AcrR family transcriptional regulator